MVNLFQDKTLFTCGCDRIETITRLQAEQKSLKDSANNINERIGQYVRKGIYDSAAIQKIKFEAVQARLIAVQSSIDKFKTK
jgi:hypothetical protein